MNGIGLLPLEQRFPQSYRLPSNSWNAVVPRDILNGRFGLSAGSREVDTHVIDIFGVDDR